MIQQGFSLDSGLFTRQSRPHAAWKTEEQEELGYKIVFQERRENKISPKGSYLPSMYKACTFFYPAKQQTHIQVVKNHMPCVCEMTLGLNKGFVQVQPGSPGSQVAGTCQPSLQAILLPMSCAQGDTAPGLNMFPCKGEIMLCADLRRRCHLSSDGWCCCFPRQEDKELGWKNRPTAQEETLFPAPTCQSKKSVGVILSKDLKTNDKLGKIRITQISK